MNFWHDVPLGDNVPEEFNVIIEIPRGSHNKYEVDKETGLIKLDRANYGPTPYPFDYGFAPQTLWEDDDPLDVIVLTTNPLFPGVLVKVRPVAVMHMVDDGDSDDKIIAVPVDDLRWENTKDIEDVNSHSIKEFTNFFETYKALKNKTVTIEGVEGKDKAKEAVLRAVELYKGKFKNS